MGHVERSTYGRWFRCGAGSGVLAGGALLLSPAAALAAGPPDSFGAKTDYSSGNGQAVAVGNFNADAYPDLAVANTTGNTVSVLLNNGNGTYGAATANTTGNNAYGVAVGDVNGDSKIDIVVANYTSNSVSILLGNGNGTFATKTDVTVGTGPMAVALGDLDHNGYLDVVTSNKLANKASVLLNNGNGTFAAKTDYTTGSLPWWQIALGDVNGDTYLDMVTVNRSSNSVSVLLNNGNGTFAAKVDSTVARIPWGVALGDLNGDGFLDAVAASAGDSKVSVLLGNGNGTFAAKVDYATGSTPNFVAITDVNGDGRLDVAVSNQGTGANSASILLGNGNGTLAAKTDYTTGTGPRSVTLSDVNGDRKPDIITSNGSANTTSVLFNTTAMALSQNGDTLRLTPQPGSTFGATTKYTIQYNTPARATAGKPWGVWANNWPADKLGIGLAATQTVAGCQTVGGAGVVCTRPSVIGEQDPGETYVYRLYAYNGTVWGPATSDLGTQVTVTRPLPPG